MDFGVVIVLSAWGVLAGSAIVRLRRRGSAAFDDPLTPADRRALSSAAMYLAVPPIILAAQLIQLALTSRFFGGISRFDSYVFWGVVEPVEPAALGHLAHAGWALISPLTLTLVAGFFVGFTLRVPRNAALNFLRLELARVLLVLGLAVHPVVSLVAQEGDLHVVRTALNQRHPASGDLALLGFGILAAYAFWRWSRAIRLRRMGTPLFDAVRAALARVAENPDDAAAWGALGAAQLASEDHAAVTTLERAAELAPNNVKTALFLGRAHLKASDARAAAKHLRRAGQLVEAAAFVDQSLLFEITLALSAARIALGDGEGAILTAEMARKASPIDPRGMLMHVDALVAGGRIDEARTRLETAAESATGRLRLEIRQRLAALRR